MSVWDTDGNLREELARLRRSLDAQLQQQNLRPPRPPLCETKSWEEIVRKYAVTPSMIPLSPVPKVGPLPQFKISRSTIESAGKNLPPSRYSSEPAHHKPVKRTPRRIWTDRLQEMDVYFETEPICAMFFSEQEDFYSRLGDQLGATGSLKLVCPGGTPGSGII